MLRATLSMLAVTALCHGFSMPKQRVAVLGASGYTGAELVRILLQHPYVDIAALTADRNAGQPFSAVYPQFATQKQLPDLVKMEDLSYDDIDVVFACLPHAKTQEIVAELPEHLKVIDLSADFRLFDTDVYEEWYGKPHSAKELQKTAVYGLCELARDEIKGARLVANPGCYPTAAQLPLIPLLAEGLIRGEDIIIDAKSGTTGAGRSPKQGTLFCEVTDGIHAYGVASHRHAPEIEQGLNGAADGGDIKINFTPHLMPMNRGILETIYVKTTGGADAAKLKAALKAKYEGEPFVHVLEDATVPQTRHVRGSNHVIISAIDNLVKGASGQAVQNMNLVCGFPEDMAISMAPMFP